jgi:DNA-binding NarL/FixJ family response regulator
MAIREVLSGKLYLSAAMKDKIIYTIFGDNGSDVLTSPADCLTDCETEVFIQLGQGRQTRQIAEQLCLSIKTIETYRSRIKEKLKLRNGSELLQRSFQWVNRKDKKWFPVI